MLTIEDLLYMQDVVVNWNKIFGIEVGDKSRVDLYAKLSFEEMFDKNEFMQSYEQGDHTGIMDGLADMTFTVFMWALLESEENIIELDDAFLLEPTQLYPEQTLINSLSCTIAAKEAFNSQTHLLQLLHLMSARYDVMGAFNRVAESNFSKAIDTKAISVDTDQEIKLIEEAGRYADVTCESVDDYLVFKAGKDVETGVTFEGKKIIKSTHFVSVEDLGGLMEFKYVQ